MIKLSSKIINNMLEASTVHVSWRFLLQQALGAMDVQYINNLNNYNNWLPGVQHIFSAFSRPICDVRYVLVGESPYPRAESANGYAFWDARVKNLWCNYGLCKEVNRATSLRNFIKMLLLARGDLDASDVSKYAIARLNHENYVQTAEQLFTGMLQKGFLLLNASLVYREQEVNYHAQHWRPFINIIVQYLSNNDALLHWILLGNIAKKIILPHTCTSLIAEHPYNISFIFNSAVLTFFRPLDLLGLYA